MAEADIQLSQHFRLGELIQSQTAERRGIDNYPNKPAIDNLRLTCKFILEPVRLHFNVPFSPNSGYRCPKLNQAVGGSKTSQHVIGQAVDFTVPGVKLPVLYEWIKDNLEFDQLILEFYNSTRGTGWIHCSYRARNNRKDAFRIGS